METLFNNGFPQGTQNFVRLCDMYGGMREHGFFGLVMVKVIIFLK